MKSSHDIGWDHLGGESTLSRASRNKPQEDSIFRETGKKSKAKKGNSEKERKPEEHSVRWTKKRWCLIYIEIITCQIELKSNVRRKKSYQWIWPHRGQHWLWLLF